MRRALFLAGALLLLPGIALAQGGALPPLQLIPTGGNIGSCNFVTGEFHFECFPLYLAFLIQVLFGFVAGGCLLHIVWGGYEWALAGLGGDTQGAKKRIQNAIIGLTMAVLTFLIIDTILLNLLSGPSSL